MRIWVDEWLDYDPYDRYDPHDIMTLYYDSDINRFIDEMGTPQYDIYRFISPDDVLLFKENVAFGDTFVIPDRTRSFLVELVKIK